MPTFTRSLVYFSQSSSDQPSSHPRTHIRHIDVLAIILHPRPLSEQVLALALNAAEILESLLRPFRAEEMPAAEAAAVTQVLWLTSPLWGRTLWKPQTHRLLSTQSLLLQCPHFMHFLWSPRSLLCCSMTKSATHGVRLPQALLLRSPYTYILLSTTSLLWGCSVMKPATPRLLQQHPTSYLVLMQTQTPDQSFNSVGIQTENQVSCFYRWERKQKLPIKCLIWQKPKLVNTHSYVGCIGT